MDVVAKFCVRYRLWANDSNSRECDLCINVFQSSNCDWFRLSAVVNFRLGVETQLKSMASLMNAELFDLLAAFAEGEKRNGAFAERAKSILEYV